MQQKSRVSGTNGKGDRAGAMTRTPVTGANHIIPDPYTCIWCWCFRGRWRIFRDSHGKLVSGRKYCTRRQAANDRRGSGVCAGVARSRNKGNFASSAWSAPRRLAQNGRLTAAFVVVEMEGRPRNRSIRRRPLAKLAMVSMAAVVRVVAARRELHAIYAR